MATYGQLIEFGPYFSGGALCTLKVYHYASGSTTLQDVYTDRDKNTTAAQPLTSDSNGIAVCYADGIYKFRIDGSTDGVNYSTLYTDDKWAVSDQSSNLTGEGAAIASASTLTLGTDGDFFHVTGSTGPITAISGTQTRITLVFDAAPTLTHSGSLILQDGVDYVAAANVTMQLINEGGGVWREISRTPTAYAVIDAKGDLIVGTSNDNADNLTVGANGTILIARSAATLGMAYVPALFGTRYGHTYAHGDGAGAGDQTNDFTFAAGGCMDITGAYWIQTVALTKQADAAWAVGTGAGMLDTGAVGNSSYYLFVIARSDTGVTDYLMSLSPTAPTMPANYDFKRLIGWFKRLAGVNVLLHTYETEGGGLSLMWDSPTLDINAVNTLNVRRTDAVKVPLDFSVIANLNIMLSDAAAGGHAYIYCPDMTDLAASQTVAPLATHTTEQITQGSGGNYHIRTSATGTIAARANITYDTYAVSTLGFRWARRN